MQYRREIDGLRAIAIIPVMLFHAGINLFSGGYIGVDVFFVISGYLITTIILEDIKRGKFSIVNFYERRVRRIIPALYFLLMVLLLSAWFLMTPSQLMNFSKSLVTVALFYSNIHFWQETDYFGPIAEENPLLHMWSLAVEEQFYVIFPLLMMLILVLRQRTVFVFIGVLLLTSLFSAQWISESSPTANFFLAPTRVWELLIGAIVAFLLFNKKVMQYRYSGWLAGLGILMIMVSVFWFDKQTPFPSVYALLPTVGTAFIILFTSKQTLVARVLGNKIFVGIGLISYPLYLWHQPIFAYIRMKTLMGTPKIELILFGIAAAFIFAMFSYHFVEKPFRDRRKVSRNIVFKMSLFITISLVGFGVIGGLEQMEGYKMRFKENYFLQKKKLFDQPLESPKRYSCHFQDYREPERACTYYRKNITWAAFGDSHVVEMAHALAKKIEKHDEGLIHLSFAGCSPALLYQAKLKGCSNWINDTLKYLEGKSKITNIFVGFRHTFYLYGEPLALYPELPNENPGKTIFKEFNASGHIARELYWESFNTIVRRLIASGKKVYVLRPVPELAGDIRKYPYPISTFHELNSIQFGTSFTYYSKRNDFINRKLDTLVGTLNYVEIDPAKVFCGPKKCKAVINGELLYSDDNHLSIYGADKVLRQYLPAVE
jgi:peptidoglycan/LPS O-acetylase OafA/YrhL